MRRSGELSYVYCLNVELMLMVKPMGLTGVSELSCCFLRISLHFHRGYLIYEGHLQVIPATPVIWAKKSQAAEKVGRSF